MEFQLLSSAPGSTSVTVFPRRQHKRMLEAGIISGKGKCSPGKEVIHFLLNASACPSDSVQALYRQG